MVTQPSSRRCSAVSSDLFTCKQSHQPMDPSAPLAPPPQWRSLSASQKGAGAARWARYLAVEEALQLQLSDAQLPVFLGEAPARLSEVELGPPGHTDVLQLFAQLHLVCPLQLEIFKTPAQAGEGKP